MHVAGGEGRLRVLSIESATLCLPRRRHMQSSIESSVEARVSRKLAWRIIPFVMLLYFISFLDRVNVGFAAMTMNKAIGLSPTAFGLGGGLFFIGYFLFEVP